MASVEYAVRDVYGEVKEYVDKNMNELNRRFHKYKWKSRIVYRDGRTNSVRREKRWR